MYFLRGREEERGGFTLLSVISEIDSCISQIPFWFWNVSAGNVISVLVMLFL